MSYTGRFAPSPTGALHFGSLLAAVASFVDARAHHGRWLVRIEDIDPPRIVLGADTLILHTLEQHARSIGMAPYCTKTSVQGIIVMCCVVAAQSKLSLQL